MRILLAFTATMALAACLPIPVKVWDESARAPKPGDLVRVETLGGKREVMRIYRVDEAGFAGVGRDEHRYRVLYSVVKVLEVRKTETDWVVLPIPL